MQNLKRGAVKVSTLLTVLCFFSAASIYGGVIVTATTSAGWNPSASFPVPCTDSDMQTSSNSASVTSSCGVYPADVSAMASGSGSFASLMGSATVHTNSILEAPPFSFADALVSIVDTESLLLLGGSGTANLSLTFAVNGFGVEQFGVSSSTTMEYNGIAVCPPQFGNPLYGFRCVPEVRVSSNYSVTFGIPFNFAQSLTLHSFQVDEGSSSGIAQVTFSGFVATDQSGNPIPNTSLTFAPEPGTFWLIGFAVVPVLAERLRKAPAGKRHARQRWLRDPLR
jgi:hypothetical protein